MWGVGCGVWGLADFQVVNYLIFREKVQEFSPQLLQWSSSNKVFRFIQQALVNFILSSCSHLPTFLVSGYFFLRICVPAIMS
ncbi:MAG: hypothetical protein EWV40_17150 [Microcystis flos-aquae Mf_WU_F_19750830_S460]|uniref:Uncharacterized protein n=1 Tax=Microcystis flos-aquae Mf_WU_F_19750830_S460 TaxID=2486237 RepID=A0A552LE66_9CHRO|nr:MAG: hypothetical protein EWV40_17150 [Microcystis flos-aquae Mf_WU_F_19750830_S460]